MFFVFVLYLSNYFFAKYYVLSNHNNFEQEGDRPGINKNVTDTFRHSRGVSNAGSQLTWEGGRAGINKNVTDTKRDRRGVKTDLLDV